MLLIDKNPLPNQFVKLTLTLWAVILAGASLSAQISISYPIVDTKQEIFYDSIDEIAAPAPGEVFYGQDAHYTGFTPQYQDNGDGTISDLVTGLMWAKSPDTDGDGDIDYEDKMSYTEATTAAENLSLAGYDDWRLPTIKELYSLIIFSGKDPSGYNGTSTEDLLPFIDTDYFDFAYGDVNAGERIIDAQMVSSNLYVGTTMGGEETMFGVNFADGRIKGYPTGPMPGQTEGKQFYVYFVRGNTSYGNNDFQDNNDGTVTDHATGLMWTKDDSGGGMPWMDALNYAENAQIANYTDWRLPNSKELQSIVDYNRAPGITNSAAIDPVFNCSTIIDEGGSNNFPFYWSSTTHASWQENATGGNACYVCFGEALGWMEQPPMSGNYTLMDVHGAGAQRSDPKVGDPSNWPYGHGPQGDVVRIFNYVRLVRDSDSTMGYGDHQIDRKNISIYPNPVSGFIYIEFEGHNQPTVNIYNSNGKRISSESLVSGETYQMNVSSFPAGLYFVSITSSAGISSGRFIKE